MNTPEQIATTFYDAFKAGDGGAMAALYNDTAHFHDPVFEDLNGVEAGAMWKMLTSRAKDLDIEWHLVESDDTTAKVHWEAKYTFSATERFVHNKIDAALTIRDGKIVEHIDTFSWRAWSKQAIGLKALLLGPVVKKAVREQAKKGLMLFMKRHKISASTP